MMRYLLLLLFIWSCGSTTQQADYLPRPKGFNRLVLPSPAFKQLENGHPYMFEISKYAQVIPDTAQIGNKKQVWKAEPHWIYIYYPRWDAFIQITYKSLGG